MPDRVSGEVVSLVDRLNGMEEWRTGREVADDLDNDVASMFHMSLNRALTGRDERYISVGFVGQLSLSSASAIAVRLFKANQAKTSVPNEPVHGIVRVIRECTMGPR